MNEELNLDQVYQEYWNFNIENIKGGARPLAIAGVMLAQALSMYKTILKPSEFEMLMDTISESRDDVKVITINTQLQ
jgi:hypothetical protein